MAGLYYAVLEIIVLFSKCHSFVHPNNSKISITHYYSWKLLHSIPDSNHIDGILNKMIRYYGQDMVDSTSNRFYYYCRPYDGKCEHVHMPLRDLAAAWDATKAIDYLGNCDGDRLAMKQSLRDSVRSTLEYYLKSLDYTEHIGLTLKGDVILEPVNIGHSALLMLAACNALELNIMVEDDINNVRSSINDLALGVLSMQLENGALSTYFGNTDYFKGLAFFPGEAMLALITAFQHNILDTRTKDAVIPAMMKAFSFYCDYHKTGDVDMNYNIWQVMAFSALHESLGVQLENNDVASYILEMCAEICESTAWKYELRRGQSFYANLKTVEIACGLDALVDGIRIAKIRHEEELASHFERNAANAVHYLSWAQSQVPESSIVGYGGLGYGGTYVLEQRLDVTGHALSALVKLQKLVQTDAI